MAFRAGIRGSRGLLGRFGGLCRCPQILGRFLCPLGGSFLNQDDFSRCHPAVNFLFFVLAIAFGAVVQHPAYTAAGVILGGVYTCILYGRRGLRRIFGMLPLFLLITFLNPVINTSGKRVLFLFLNRPYTWEALCYGMSLGGIFLTMLLWFGCYSAVMTSDKFTSLFGSLIPSLSLLLVMVLRMIPGFTRKAEAITGARKTIGKGVSQSGNFSGKARGGMTVLSALTTWALEGSIVTADSMRARGYGCGKRTVFHRSRFTWRDGLLIALMALLTVGVLIAGGMDASFTPVMKVPPLSWGFYLYCALLLLPAAYDMKEGIAWRISRSGI